MCHQEAHKAGWSCFLVSTQPLDHPARLSVVTCPRRKYLKHLVCAFKIEAHVVQTGVDSVLEQRMTLNF